MITHLGTAPTLCDVFAIIF
uniref:Uncharacterized protein n=1 Tax=Anguilla anguilla TaxID=7936 RepID=A0A0E9PFZ0_ANGAN